MAASGFRIERAREDDIAEIAAILNPSFEHIPVEQMLGNLDTPAGRQATGERHLRAWREHAAVSAVPCAIKCVHADPDTGRETIAGFAEWFIHDAPRPAEQYRRANYLVSAAWLPEEGGARAKVTGLLAPMVEARVRWMAGRPHGLLMYMGVRKEWRRRGASTLCVRWGVEKCTELGIPAYLEASDEGAPVYRKLGFEEVEKLSFDFDGVEMLVPIMIKWPPGTSHEDKKPALA